MDAHNLFTIPTMIAPDADAVIDERGGAWTYARLGGLVDAVVEELDRLGVEPGDRVAVMSTNTVDAVAAVLACFAGGAVAVPLNFRAGPDELGHVLGDASPRATLAQARYLDLLAGVGHRGVDLGAARERADRPPLEVGRPGTELAAILYTSGTTSRPKGVPISHQALTSYVMGNNDAADGSDQGRMLLAAPLHHIAGLTSLLNALYSGRTVVLLPQFDADEWLRAVDAHRVTDAFVVPTMLARILRSPVFDQVGLSSLRSVTYGAAPMPPSVIEEAIDRFPSDVGFAGAYGQTETTSTVAVLDADDHRLEGTDDEVAAKRARLRSVGRVVDDVEIKIADGDGEELGPDEIGEVWLRTPRSMAGYWGEPGRTRIVVDADGWIHTGDLGRVDDGGYLFLVGRTGDMIIRGGENISPEEVEHVLLEHPGVLDAAVAGVPDTEWGEQVAAWVVVDDGTRTDDLVAWCREHLTAFKRPTRFTVVDELPRTSTGKLLRRSLVGDQSPDPTSVTPETGGPT